MEPLQIAGAITVVVGACTALGVGGRFMLRMGRNITNLRDDLLGEPARAGVPRRPGVVERLGLIEKELHPNGGTSMRDAINRVERGLEEQRTKLDTYIEAQKLPVNVNVNVPQVPPAATPGGTS